MTLTLELPAALERRLVCQAEADGTTVAAAAVALLEKAAPPEKTFAEIAAPVHEEFLASGMTDEELEAFLRDEIDAYRRENRGAAGLCRPEGASGNSPGWQPRVAGNNYGV